MLFMDRKELIMKLKVRRISLGLHQEDVAQAIDMDRSQYARVETGKIDINLTMFLKAMAFLKLNWVDLARPQSDLVTLPGEGEKDTKALWSELNKIKVEVAELHKKKRVK